MFFEYFICGAALMVLLLFRNVLQYRGQVPLCKACYTISSLPMQCVRSVLLVDLIRAGPLDLADEITHQDRWLDLNGKMDMRFCAPDFLKTNTLGIRAVVLNELMKKPLDHRTDLGLVAVTVPIDV